MLTTWRTQVFAPFQARTVAGIPEAGQIPAAALALPTFRLPGILNLTGPRPFIKMGTPVSFRVLLGDASRINGTIGFSNCL